MKKLVISMTLATTFVAGVAMAAVPTIQQFDFSNNDQVSAFAYVAGGSPEVVNIQNQSNGNPTVVVDTAHVKQFTIIFNPGSGKTEKECTLQMGLHKATGAQWIGPNGVAYVEVNQELEVIQYDTSGNNNGSQILNCDIVK